MPGEKRTMLWGERTAEQLLLRLHPSETLLLDWLKPRIDDSLLAEIAAADYGSEKKQHLKALKPIRDQQQIPIPLRWVPREVLELMRWSEPEDPNWKPGSTGTRGHLIRAFSCAVLLQAADEPQTQPYISSENETLIQLIASVLALDREATEAAMHFLCWRISRLPLSHEEYPFFILGLLLLQCALFKPGEDGTDLELLADWTIEAERRTRQEPDILVNSETWLLGLTHFDQKHETWKRVSLRVLSDPTKAFPSSSTLHGIIGRIMSAQS
ncbi:MAG: hypothetical protein ACRYFS_14740 [Janthinobacterium lividum]